MRITQIALKTAILSAAVYSVAFPAVGFAQEQQNDEASSASNFILDEVVVTAQKREQSLQDVGISIAAMSGDQMTERGIDNIDGLANSIPNVQLFNLSGGGVPVVILRGVGLQNFRINDTPTTGIYVDDVYQVSIAQIEGTMFDTERVEILKGPQGGLYGRNAVGGAIQYISRKPNFDEAEGYASLAYGRYDRVEVEGAVGLPVADNFAVRVAGRVVTSGDTYFRSTTGGFNHGEQERWAGRVMASWLPSETTTVDLKVHAGEDNSETALFRTVGAYEPSGLFLPGISFSRISGLAGFCASILAGGPREPGRCTVSGGQTPESFGVEGRYDSASTTRPGLDNDWWGVSLKVSQEYGNTVLTSITAYDKYNYMRRTEPDNVPDVKQEINYGSKIEAWSQELRLAYDGGGAVRWLFGASYSEDTLDEASVVFAEVGIFPVFLGSTRFDQNYMQESKSFSVYGRVDYELSDVVNVAVEGRYTTENKSLVGGLLAVDNNNVLSFIDDEATFDAFTGKVVAEWRATDDVLAYASVGRGFKTGGFFGGFATSQEQLDVPYENEFIVAYEVGVKSEWLEGRARINASVFYYDRTDVQANAGVEDDAGVLIDRLTNIGDVRTLGAELDATVVPIDGLTLTAGFGYVDAEITRSDVVVTDFFSGAEVSPEGLRIPQQPKFNLNFLGRYEVAISSSSIAAFQVEYSYQTERDLGLVKSVEEGNFLTEPSFGLLNLGVSIASDDGLWEISGRIDNVTEVHYRVSARDITEGGLYEIFGAPRTWKVTVTTKW